MRCFLLILAAGLAVAAAQANAREDASDRPPAPVPIAPAVSPAAVLSPDAPIVAIPGVEQAPAAVPPVRPEPTPIESPAAPPPGDAASTADAPAAEPKKPPIKPLPLLTDFVRDVLARKVEGHVWSALMVASIDSGDIATAAFGHLEGAESAAPDAATRFQLGGVTAAYTGLLLADLAASGKVRLSDPISAFLPPGATCADARICAITLAQLASDRSGLPPLPANLLPRDSRDPFREYGEAELLAFLAGYRPVQWPTPASDSLLADGLLGWALGRAHGGGYAAALRERVLVPLGLAATEFEDADLAPGYSGGNPARVTHFGVLAGAAGLRSTAGDQATLLKAMLQPGETPLRSALLLARQAQDEDGDRGLGWRLAYAQVGGQSWPIVWQRGETGGHASFVGFRTDRQQAVVLLGNNAMDLSALGLSMLRGEGISGAPTATLAVNPDNLDEYAGLYAFGPGREVVVRARNGILTVQQPGQLAVRVNASGEDAFATADGALQLFFARGERRRIEALRWAQGGYNVPAERLSDKAPQLDRVAHPFAADALAAVCGDYIVDANVTARLACVNGNIYFQMTGANERAVFPYAADRLATVDGEIELRVERDAAGKPVALVLGLLGKELTLPRADAGDDGKRDETTRREKKSR